MNVRESMPSESDVFAESLSSSKPLARECIFIFKKGRCNYTYLCVFVCVYVSLCVCVRVTVLNQCLNNSVWRIRYLLQCPRVLRSSSLRRASYCIVHRFLKIFHSTPIIPSSPYHGIGCRPARCLQCTATSMAPRTIRGLRCEQSQPLS